MSKNSSMVSKSKNKQECFLAKFGQKWILRSEFRKSKSDFESVLPRYQVCQFLAKQTILTFSVQIFPKMNFGGRYFKNLSPYSESAPEDTMCANFQAKRTSLSFFGLNLGKLPDYMRYFGSYNLDGV